LRLELSKSDVHISCIEPGLVRTGLHDRWEVPPSELLGIPEPQEPEDIARLVLFILEQPANMPIPQMMLMPQSQAV
jgi:NADP-dependent 3-hydroxy acid dehydrogenase YdfG